MRLSSGGVAPDFKFPTDQQGLQALFNNPQTMQVFQKYQRVMSGWRYPQDPYVFWHSVDDRARELSYDGARAEVVKAWKQQEARKLALAEANRVEAEAGAEPSPQEAVKYLRDQKDGEVFELPGVARWSRPLWPTSASRTPFIRYTFPGKPGHLPS